MDYYMSAIIMFCLLSLSSASTWMTYRYALLPRVGRPGPVGPRGPPGTVNYTATEEKIVAKYLDLESRIVEKIVRFKRIVGGQLNRSNLEIEKIRNETEKGINENQKDFEARIDERFARLKRIAEARLDRGDKEIETIRNETTKEAKSMEENQKYLESRIDAKIVRFKRVVVGQLKRSNVEIEKIRNETEKGINESRKDLENVIDEKIEQIKKIVQGQLDGNNVEIEKLRNETEKGNIELRKDLEAKINESFEKLERTVMARLVRHDTEIEKLQNETTKNSKTIEELRKRAPIWPSCDDVPRSDHESRDGKSGIFNVIRDATLYEVYCDLTTDGGGWTVFQRRMDGTVDFYRDWEDYATGFGFKSGEFWLGLEAVYQLTQDGAYELRIDLADWDGSTAYANYGTFSISGRSDNYRLTIGEYSGTAGNALNNSNNGSFSAKNKDLDGWYSGGNCATAQHAAWWFNGCGSSSLNGRYNDTSGYRMGVYWYHWKKRNPYSLKASEMKFRKK